MLKMKKNRSNKFTQGIVITNNTNSDRFLFFELDKPFNSKNYHAVLDVYTRYGIDLVVHRTGNGWHFLSPTLIDIQTWKKAMKELKEINKKCPMTTLRWLPNKYPNENEVWYNNEHWIDSHNSRNNSNEFSKLLNKVFHTEFEGTIQTDLKFVRYPLP